MKKITLIVYSLITVTLFACTKTGVEEKKEADLYNNSPGSEIPEELLGGRWLENYIGILHYIDNTPYTLSTDRNDYGQVYKFSNGGANGKQGRFELYGYLGNRTSFGNCVTHNLKTIKGTVKFDGHVVTFYPIEGTKKLEKKGCQTADTKTQEKLPTAELKEESYYWNYSADRNGFWAFRLYNLDDINMQNEIHSYRKVN